MKIETAIQGYYEQRLSKCSDLEFALLENSKEELVQFIMDEQCRGRFSDWQDKGNYNQEFIEIWGEIE